MPDINYFVCVGGTGSQIGESFVYLAACGYLGQGKTKIWIVDKDTKCASGLALNYAVNDYKLFREDCRKGGSWFAHELELHTWNFDGALAYVDPAANGDSPFSALGNADADTQMMMHFLHDTESLHNSMSRGFYGRAQTGTALYKAIEKSKYLNGDALFADIQREITAGKRPCVYFAGSSFGATGASLLPNMAKTLRTTFTDKIVIGGVLMLPYFSYDDKPEDGSKALVSPDTHWNKAQEALKYYGNPAHMTIRRVDGKLSGPDVFDSFYIAGSIPLIKTGKYADGGEKQDNNRHIAELYAAMGAQHFFRLCKGEKEKNGGDSPAVHAYALGTPLDTQSAEPLNWGDLDPALMLPMLSLTRFCVAMLTCLYPMTHPLGDLRQDDTMKKCFGADGFMGKGRGHIDIDTVKSNTKCAAEFSKRFLDYLVQINDRDLPVRLFEWDFLPMVQQKLITFPRADPPVYRFKEFALPEAYSPQDRGNIQLECQLRRIRSDLTKDPDTSTYANNLREYVINQMGRTIAKRKPAVDAYPQHTAEGMQELYQAAFDYCNSLGGY